MKIGVFSREKYRNTGIETFESNVCPELLETVEGSEAISFQPRTWYPFSLTVERATMGRRVRKKMAAGEFDKLFIPAQDRVQFDPASVDTKVVPYIHDIIPVTSCYKKYSSDSIAGRLSGYLSTVLATRYVKFIANCEEVICSTEFVKKELEERTSFNGEAHVVYQGVDDKTSSFSGERDIDLLYVGGTIERKNPDFLEKVLKEAEKAGFKVATANYTDLGLPGESFVNLSDEELADLYARSRYYIHPSYMEGFGRTPVEAQKNGCVPIGLDTGINQEVLGNGFIPVEEDADKVVSVLYRDVSKDLRRKARKNSERFKWSKCVEQIREVLEN